MPRNSLIVDSFVCVADGHDSRFERVANPQKRPHCHRATGFHLLPMAGGESEGNHILLAVAASVAEFLASLAKSFEEFRVIYQAATFYFSLARNTTSRLGFSIVSVLHLRSMPRLPRAKKAQ